MGRLRGDGFNDDGLVMFGVKVIRPVNEHLIDGLVNDTEIQFQFNSVEIYLDLFLFLYFDFILEFYLVSLMFYFDMQNEKVKLRHDLWEFSFNLISNILMKFFVDLCLESFCVNFNCLLYFIDNFQRIVVF